MSMHSTPTIKLLTVFKLKNSWSPDKKKKKWKWYNSSHMEGMVPHLARRCKSGANNCVLGQFLYEVHVVSWIKFP